MFLLRRYHSISSHSQHTELSAAGVSQCVCRGPRSGGRTLRCSDRHRWGRMPLCLVSNVVILWLFHLLSNHKSTDLESIWKRTKAHLVSDFYPVVWFSWKSSHLPQMTRTNKENTPGSILTEPTTLEGDQNIWHFIWHQNWYFLF